MYAHGFLDEPVRNREHAYSNIYACFFKIIWYNKSIPTYKEIVMKTIQFVLGILLIMWGAAELGESLKP